MAVAIEQWGSEVGAVLELECGPAWETECVKVINEMALFS